MGKQNNLKAKVPGKEGRKKEPRESLNQHMIGEMDDGMCCNLDVSRFKFPLTPSAIKGIFKDFPFYVALIVYEGTGMSKRKVARHERYNHVPQEEDEFDMQLRSLA